MTGKPIADRGLMCPLFRKDVSKVCHTCAWYTRIAGMHPQTGDHMEKWMCAQTAVVLTTIDAGRAAAEGSATTQELRNDLQRERVGQARLLASRAIVQDAPALAGSDVLPRITHEGGNG